VEVFLLTSDTLKIKPGMEVLLIQKNNSQDLSFRGKVEKIAPAAVEKTSPLGLAEQRLKITVQPDIPENLILRRGYALDVQFTPEKLDNQLVIPKTALFPYEEGEAVWVVRKDKAQIQKVRKGFENEREAAITEGLISNDAVIRNPQLKGLKEGQKVKSMY
jgi:HlyD family secretion protein